MTYSQYYTSWIHYIRKLGIALVWLSIFLPILSISHCSDSQNELEEQVEVELDPIETFYGYHLLMGTSGAMSEHNSLNDSYQPLLVTSQAASSSGVNTTTIVFFGLSLILAIASGLLPFSADPKKHAEASVLFRVALSSLFAIIGMLLFCILELSLSTLFIFYHARELGIVLVYLGFSILFLAPLPLGFTLYRQSGPILPLKGAERFARLTMLCLSVTLTTSLLVAAFYLMNELYKITQDTAEQIRALFLLSPTILMSLLLAISLAISSLMINKAVQTLQKESRAWIFALWLAPYALLLLPLCWAVVVDSF